MHTISIFANPLMNDKPTLDAPDVLAVKPGEMPPSNGPWTTLYFLPGVHDLGLAFPLRANCQYYIPGDAIVYGTLSNRQWGDGHHVTIRGLGTLSGARLKHPNYVEPEVSEKEHGLYRPIELVGTTLIEDCFLRTQDDSLYVNGLGIRRCVLWNDANGSSFVLSSLSSVGDRKLVVEDCDVIYARAKWHHWSGGRVFNIRAENNGEGGSGVIFRNINIEDPRPTPQQFFLCMTVPPPYSNEAKISDAGDVSGVLFQNISIAAPSVLGEPQVLWGQSDARIRNLTFENMTVAGKPVRDAEFFKTNDFVHGLNFTTNPDAKP